MNESIRCSAACFLRKQLQILFFLNRIVETENIMFSCHSHHFENDVLVTTRLNEAPN